MKFTCATASHTKPSSFNLAILSGEMSAFSWSTRAHFVLFRELLLAKELFKLTFVSGTFLLACLRLSFCFLAPRRADRSVSSACAADSPTCLRKRSL